MAKLVALKKLRYPRGPDGREYGPGDPFEVSNERDAKALTLVRAAMVAPADVAPAKAKAPPPPPEPPPARTRTPPAEAAKTQEGPVAVTSTDTAEALVSGRNGRYRRSDMRSKE